VNGKEARSRVLEGSGASNPPRVRSLSFIKGAKRVCNGNPDKCAEFESTFQKLLESYSARSGSSTVTFYLLPLGPMVKNTKYKGQQTTRCVFATPPVTLLGGWVPQTTQRVSATPPMTLLDGWAPQTMRRVFATPPVTLLGAARRKIPGVSPLLGHRPC
jgi:hypothetical protein